MMRLGKVGLARIVALVAFVVVAVTAWFVVLSPRLSTASELTAQAQQLQDANLALRNQYNAALAQAEAAPAAAAEAQELFAKMPRTADLPAVLEQIAGAATAAGIPADQVAELMTGIPVPVNAGAADRNAEPAAGVQIAQMQIAVKTEGRREQVLTFLDNLQALDRALLIESTLTARFADPAGDGGSRETMDAAGSMFVLQSELPDLVATVEGLIAEAEAQQDANAAPSDTADPADAPQQ